MGVVHPYRDVLAGSLTCMTFQGSGGLDNSNVSGGGGGGGSGGGGGGNFFAPFFSRGWDTTLSQPNGRSRDYDRNNDNGFGRRPGPPQPGPGRNGYQQPYESDNNGRSGPFGFFGNRGGGF